MPAPYDYATSGGYARTRADWVDFPSTSTPITQAQLDQFDQATYDVKRLTFNVKDYGAKGDSPTTDDTTAIQNALDACRTAGGGTVFVPDGTYKTTADLIIGSNTLLRGTGRGKAIIKRASTTATVAVIKNFDRSASSADTDIVISDLTVWRDGEATTANTAYDNAIYMQGPTRVTVRNCRVRGGAKNVHFEGCLNWDVTGNYFDTFVDNGFAANPLTARTTGYGRVSNNYFAVPTASGIALGSTSCIVCQSGVTVIGNTFQDANSQAIEAAWNIARLSQVNVIGNVMKHSGAANVSNSILFGDRMDDCLIEGNELETGSINVTTNAATDLNNRISVVGNKILTGTLQLQNVTNGLLLGNTVQTGLLNISSCRDVLVSDCIVSKGTASGVKTSNRGSAQTTARIRFFNCVSFDNGTAHTGGDRYGFFVDSGDTIAVKHCRAYDVTAGDQTHGLYVNATTNFYEDGNEFYGNATAERAAFTGSPTLSHMPTIASATSLVVPSTAKLVLVTGTTTITGIPFTYPGHQVTLKFAGALTFTDGSGLNLAGNFVTTADDTITLVCDGVAGVWYETGRSVN